MAGPRGQPAGRPSADRRGMMRPRSLLVVGATLAALLATPLVAGAAAQADKHPNVLTARVLQAAAGLGSTAADPGASMPAGRHTRQLGRLHIPGGLHADVWAHGNSAYVGTWSGPCPGTGVKIIDVANPASPKLVATAAGYPNTSAEDMEVLSVWTPAFTGDLLATGLQDCGLEGQAPGLTGVDLWDVTDPRHPSHLGFFDTGAGGTHEVSLTRQVRGGQERVFALAAVPFSEIASGGTVGDFQLVEVTDPRHPVRTDDWGVGKDGGLPFGIAGSGLPAPFDCTPPPGQQPLCRGHFGAVFDHSASPSTDGTRAYLAYWAARPTRRVARATRTRPCPTRLGPCWSPPTRTSAPASSSQPESRRRVATRGLRAALGHRQPSQIGRASCR